MFEGEQLGRWVVARPGPARDGFARRTAAGRCASARPSNSPIPPGLEADQQDLLTAIGIEADPKLVAAKAAAEAKPKVSRVDRFAQGLAALARFVEREVHVRVPRPHKEPLEVAVAGPGGEETVERRAKLTPGQLAQLAEHGVEWA
ncbi:hypothetical protein [Kitasatospora sp. KL5]|uniref:hypothetical protein n=1 Tax=Kitasatospora sp. KL5 TaxID=3425125 RepID=UPI003D6F54ED